MSAPVTQENEKKGVARVFGFLSESVDELKKVSQPTRQETIQATIGVVIMISLVSVALFLMDFVASRLVWALIPGRDL